MRVYFQLQFCSTFKYFVNVILFVAGIDSPSDEDSLPILSVEDSQPRPAKKIKLDAVPKRSILKRTRTRRRFSTPRKTFFADEADTLEYASSEPPSEIAYLLAARSSSHPLSLSYDEGCWFKQITYSWNILALVFFGHGWLLGRLALDFFFMWVSFQ